ncbi:MAG: glycoside hydrolase N-terminal domain-containing protein [Clostridia bacterium]|nr:glycoside hydrolase N-terminal domain-containing protein [Clostridia bacterium]
MNRHILKINRPASWHGELWRDALFLGNGLSGILMHGAIAEETIQCNRYNLWHGGSPGGEIPDISHTFAEMREKILSGQYAEANNNCMAQALRQKGYTASPEVPHPLGSLKISMEPETIFREYERGIHMQTAEGYVQYTIGQNRFLRRVFVSRDSDLVVLSFRADCPFTASFRFEIFCADGRESETMLSESSIVSRTKDCAYGANIRFAGEYNASVQNNRVYITGREYLVFLQLYAYETPADFTEETARTYEELLAKHTALYTPLYEAVSVELADDTAHTAANEELLTDAYRDIVSPVLLEKLWRFGRYLFISASSDRGYPVPLYGLWHGGDQMPWSQYVANENVQMTYWHTLNGGLASCILPLIRYYTAKTEVFRECAKKLFGINGIWLSAYTTPGVSGPCVPVGVIINWISGGGWLCRHFWDYYLYTGDEETLRKDILPFMRETALFYKEYVAYSEAGQMQLAPSVSPENTPGNLMPAFFTENMGHVCPAVKNAAMDFAVMKELLTHYLEGIRITGMYAEEAEEYRNLLRNIPDYMINDDGALKEWMSGELEDHYYHRHLSHMYPLFPGEEINSRRTPEWFEACRKAVHLRKLGGQSGWSLTHMAGIYARLEEGEKAAECLDILVKSAVNNALVTTHNDWRHMGMTLDLDAFAPVQLDANFGTVNALQEMLFRWSEGYLFLLPALPVRLKQGSANGLVFPYGTVDLSWRENELTAVIRAKKPFCAEVLVKGRPVRNVELASGETTELRYVL